MKNDCEINELRIVFDDIPDFDDQDSIISTFIHWQPLYDLYVVGDEVVITIEIAGITTKDFVLYAHRRYVIIDGTRKSAEVSGSKCCIFHNIEIPFGRFHRRIELPAPVEPKQYHYRISNGILVLRFPIIKERIIPIEDG